MQSTRQSKVDMKKAKIMPFLYYRIKSEQNKIQTSIIGDPNESSAIFKYERNVGSRAQVRPATELMVVYFRLLKSPRANTKNCFLDSPFPNPWRKSCTPENKG